MVQMGQAPLESHCSNLDRVKGGLPQSRLPESGRETSCVQGVEGVEMAGERQHTGENTEEILELFLQEEPGKSSQGGATAGWGKQFKKWSSSGLWD